ncbi:hypothetical protein JTE90_002619 [Oedothorax gibbosus]|uniref:Multidrug resistance-associated protein 1 n=1 Tax=Oedothorax gibbosus TaxID=931172 RepID=A0AAV6UDG7_9ARAC|nr:hypothetical protein JTE90_002619 [Oedothorax gibbosus]
MDMFSDFCNGSFFDLNQTWYTQTPLFSSCFEDTVFISVPSISYSSIILLNLCLLKSRQSSFVTLPWVWLNISKLCISLLLLMVSCVSCGIAFYSKFSLAENIPYSSLLSSSLRSVVFLLVIFAILKHRYCCVTTSTVLTTFWICFSVCSIFLYRTIIIKYFVLSLQPASEIVFVLEMLYHPLIFIQFFLSLFADQKRFTVLQGRNKILDDVSFLASVSFFWFYKLIHKGRKQLLVINDLSFLSIQLTAAWINKTFTKHWKYYLLPVQPKYPSLAWTLIKALWPYIFGTFATDFLCLFFLLTPPILLDRIIDFTSDDYYEWRGYFFVALIFLIDFIGKIVENNLNHFQSLSGIQFQSALMGCIFRKNLCLSTAARRDYPSGPLINLVSVDVDRIESFTMQAACLVSTPAKIILIIVIMWQYLGPSTLAGVGVMVFLFPISYYLSRIGETYTDKQMEMKDTRLKYMNEILSGIKILKLYAWEIPFGAKVTEARKQEIKWIRYSLLCYIVTTFTFFCTPFMVSLASFGTFLFVDKNNVLSPTKAFVSLTLMGQLRYALFELPDAISELVQCNISLGRIRKFLHSENKDESTIGNNPNSGESLTIKTASFSWAADGECCLNNINLHVPKGSLIAVIGTVGSGKSSLLSAILGEMYITDGTLDVEGTIAYVPQQPWILNRTLKQNILLFHHMDEQKYQTILELCCLRPDLEILPGGDETEIGEKGVTLSGGQKLRVNLAQAVYQNKDVYLLDDPLSAVDVHVRKALFNDVIGNGGLLRDKTRILVTHDLSVLPDVDLIVSMKDGRIEEMGTYHELMSQNGFFTSFVKEHSQVESNYLMQSESLSNEPTPIKVEKTASCAYEEDVELLMGEGDQISVGHSLLVNEDRSEVTTDRTHRITEEENMEIGGVNRLIYFKYVKQMGISTFMLASFGYMSFMAFETMGNVWLSDWSSDIGQNSTHNSTQTVWRLSIYGTFGLAQLLSVVFGGTFLVYGSSRASELYHKDMLENVLRSPMSFFDTTPAGRIINRFTTDLDTLDVLIFYKLEGWINCLFFTLVSFLLIGIYTPIFLAFLLPFVALNLIIQKYHLTTFRQIKRLESTSRSPIYSLFMESIQGVSSITAYGIQNEFIESFEERLDNCFLCTHNSYICTRWMTFNLDVLGSILVLVASLLAVLYRHTLSPAVVGLVVTYALSVTDALKWFIKLNSELEDKSISIERVDEYCHLKAEAPWNLPYKSLKDDWPQSGNIVFENYSTKYRENLDLVLKEINLEVNASEKVGIIGRTGAGKSSITLSLFRVIEPTSGTISIDDVDITKIGLHNLRSKLTIIPQDPLLFTGTLRMNLDPNKKHTDDELWDSLEKSYLKSFVASLNEGLDYDLEEGGANISAGQRQLVCLARALLKNSRILILDEATASVDMDTDNLIQNTIRTAFADRTVITIAHRIHTVLDYDKIIVMESGQVAEVGSPKTLLENPNCLFYQMCRESGLI